MRNHRAWLVAVLVAAVAAFAFACGDEEKTATTAPTAAPGTGTAAPTGTEPAFSGEFPVGFLTDISGGCAIIGQGYQLGVDQAVQDINAGLLPGLKGAGVNGKKLVVEFRDTQLKPEVAVQQAKDLVLSKGIKFIFGPCSSAELLALSEQVSRPLGVLLIDNMQTSARITQELGHDLILGQGPVTDTEGQSAAWAMANKLDPKPTKVAVMAPDYEYGRQTAEAFKRGLAKFLPDAELVLESYPQLNEPDFSSYIQQLLNSGAEAMYASFYAADEIAFIKQGKQVGLFDKVKYLGYGDTDFLKAIGEDFLDGALGYGAEPPYAIDTPEMKAFVERYKAAHNGEEPTEFTTQGYDMVWSLAQTIEMSGEDPTKVASTVRGQKIHTLRGELLVRECDGNIEAPLYWGTIKKTDAYPYAILTDVFFAPPDLVFTSCEDVLKNREAGGG